jgi:hypothetical protein
MSHKVTEYLPNELEWKSFVQSKYNTLLNPQDHKYILSTKKKIKYLLWLVHHNRWICKNELRSECIYCAIHSLSYVIYIPTYEDHIHSQIPYQCCLTEVTQGTVRIQFILPDHTKSLYFTISQRMVFFLQSLSFLYHIEDYIHQHSLLVTQDTLNQHTHPLFIRYHHTMKYVYMMIAKHTIPPTLDDIRPLKKKKH